MNEDQYELLWDADLAMKNLDVRALRKGITIGEAIMIYEDLKSNQTNL